MRQHLAELLGSAVATAYGSYYGTVLTALAIRSRATLADLNRSVSNLGKGDVQYALVTLVEQHLVNHHTDENGATCYEPNWENAYNFLCRLPLLHKFIEERYGSTVAGIFHAVAKAGVVSVGDLITDLCPTSAEEQGDQDAAKQGDAAQKPPSEQQKEIYGALNLLLEVGYVGKANLRQFWPYHDRDDEAVGEVMVAQFPDGVNAKKDRELLRAEANRLLKRWRKEEETYVPSNSAGGFKNGRKRNLSPDQFGGDDGRSSKRRQLVSGLPVSAEQCDSWLIKNSDPVDHNLVIAVNYDKCAVGLRTEMFVRHCERQVNPSAAKVYDALLRNIERSTPRCYDPLQEVEIERTFLGPEYEKPKSIDLGMSDQITTREVTNMLDPDADITLLAPEPDEDDVLASTEANGHHTPRRSDETSSLAVRASKVEQHLRTLVCDPQGFVRLKEGQWQVPFHVISQRLIEAEIETIITHTFGTLPARVVRVLKYYGHQELRHVAVRAMVTEEQARQACTVLQQAGWIDVVELPRTARREVTKSLWLWSFDILRARQKCLSDCYFTMSRLSMRLQKERSEIERVIDKSERTDVQGNEDKFLSSAEKEALARFERQTDKITKQMIRMDEVVAIMRDFSAMEYPHKMWDHSWIHWQSPSPEEAEGKRPGAGEESGEDEEGEDTFLE